MGERMCACVIPRSGKFLSLPDLLAFLTTKEIAKYKLPERLELLNDFPMSTFGKVSKKTLVEMVSEKIAKEHEPAPAAAQR
jgi:2,3-dihydroxybenzoate-AMP ligase